MLQLCRSCSRHIKSPRCPFCGAVDPIGVNGMPRGGPRLSRGHLLAGAAVTGLLVACSAAADEERFQEPDGELPNEVPSGSAIYGAPAADASTNTSSSGGVYGAPPAEEDAAADAADSPDARDAGADASEDGGDAS